MFHPIERVIRNRTDRKAILSDRNRTSSGGASRRAEGFFQSRHVYDLQTPPGNSYPGCKDLLYTRNTGLPLQMFRVDTRVQSSPEA